MSVGVDCGGKASYTPYIMNNTQRINALLDEIERVAERRAGIYGRPVDTSRCSTDTHIRDLWAQVDALSSPALRPTS